MNGHHWWALCLMCYVKLSMIMGKNKKKVVVVSFFPSVSFGKKGTQHKKKQHMLRMLLHHLNNVENVRAGRSYSKPEI